LSDEPIVAERVHGSSTTVSASTYDPTVHAQVAVLGPVAVTDAVGRPVSVGGRARKVLVALAMSSGAPLSIDALLDAVWPTRPPTTARKAILNGVDALERLGASYRLLAGTDLGEVNVVLAAVRAGERVTPEQLQRALDLWRGDPLCDLADWPVAEAEGRRWALIREDLEEAWAEATLTAGLTTGLTDTLEAMVSRSPLREHRWALLMQALANEGRRADALRAFERARRLLGDEVGLPPGPELAAAERSILQATPTFVTDESPEFVGRAARSVGLGALGPLRRSADRG
jgi:DNA-binding SARP family transcriptional activator